jgi:Crp-like helix-turn-helix protein
VAGWRELATKFGVKESRGTLLIPEFGHSDFAEMIGSSRPIVSRLIAEMVSAGSLIQNGKHYIVIDEQLVVDPRCAQSGSAGANIEPEKGKIATPTVAKFHNR